MADDLILYEHEKNPKINATIYSGWTDNSAQSYQFHSISISYSSSIATPSFENTALKIMVKNLWSVYRYNQEYISYLMGSYSKEEFRVIAEEFAQPFDNEIDQEFFQVATETAFNVFGHNLSSSDLSMLFNIDADAVETKMNDIGYIEYHEEE